MLLLKLWRTFKEGWRNVGRNGWLSLATVSALVLSLYVMSLTVAFAIAEQVILEKAKERVNISVYFNIDVDESTIFEIRDRLSQFLEVQKVEYISRDVALELFRNREGGENIDKALDELGYNPLKAHLVIWASELKYFDTINTQLEQSEYAPLFHRINYAKIKEQIDDQAQYAAVAQKIGLTLAAVFVFIAVLVAYNTVRMKLFAHNREFEIMRLVGASNLYIKMPSIFEGVFYGIFAALVTIALMGLTPYFVTIATQDMGSDQIFFQDVFTWFVPYLIYYIPGIFGAGILLGILSSWLAIRRYLKA